MHLIKGLKVLKILNNSNYEAYLVGGCVRDYYLNKTPNDYDITTNALPEDVLKIFKGVKTGVKYGTVTIFFEDYKFEVTTFRKEAKYINNRRPSNVSFIASAKEDVIRRDFTINGLLMNSDKEIIDYVNGINDINNKNIKTINNPLDRFKEDALRMLRAFYFESKLNFKIDPNTLKAIKENNHLIKNVASERVFEELKKMFDEENYIKALKSIYKTNTHLVIPGLSNVFNDLSILNEQLNLDIFLSLAFYLNNNIIPSYWKFSNKYKKELKDVIKLLNKDVNYNKLDLYNYGLKSVIYANYINYLLKKDTINHKEIKKMYDTLSIKNKNELNIETKTIIKLVNKKPGPWLNKLINELTTYVVLDKINNNELELKDYILKKVRKI